jgi:hypothetical protein
MKVEEDEMSKACSTNEEKRKTCMLMMRKPEGKKPLGRPRCRLWIILK